ncbi:unnamed protein product [Taenia asiatica]|uniref:Uncharacterized protein n=1 Tax=Taenia asiatica TaxID=60517 RepID=A0A158R9N8_TAEAS|nr:unnamed protein product [Taenia asiatica]
MDNEKLLGGLYQSHTVNKRLNKGTAAKYTQFLWLSAFRTNLTFCCAMTTTSSGGGGGDGGSGVGDCWSQVNSSRYDQTVCSVGECIITPYMVALLAENRHHSDSVAMLRCIANAIHPV